MNGNGGTTNSSSLLAKALDLPSLEREREQEQEPNPHHSEGSSGSSSSASPRAVAPCDPDDADLTNDYGTSMSTTPVIKNRYNVNNATSNNNHPASGERPPMSNTNNNALQSPFKRDSSFQSTGSNSSANSSSYGPDGSFTRNDYEYQHSELTIPVSNTLSPPPTTATATRPLSNAPAPPMVILPPSLVVQNSNSNSNSNSNNNTAKRSILGNTVGKKYHCGEGNRRPNFSGARIPTPNNTNANTNVNTNTNANASYGSIPPPITVVTTRSTTAGMAMTTPLSSESPSMQPLLHQPSHGSDGNEIQQQQQQQHVEEEWQPTPSQAQHKRSSSRYIPRVLPVKQYPDYKYGDYYDDDDDDIVVPLSASNNNSNSNNNKSSKDHHPENRNRDLLPTSSSRRRDFRKSVHAQSLLVGLAFMVVWLPNNAMAPNLTQMAGFFGMNDAERDLYLGSYCALALGVFCLPLSGLIGFMADFYSRKYLFLACCVLGALSAAWSGWAPNYWNLFLARLCSGGCMSGSVPVAFSLMGDLFSKEERNAASSGLTSMMGLGIILGQVYAGEVGPSKSWQYPFFVSAFVQLIMAVMVALWVEEPVRGGKEKALQGVFQSGHKYERKLTLAGFVDTMRKNASNWILLWQGFLTSLPWGIVFVFLNDYLSQEKGFTVQEATFLVMLFGVGCAIGGITGGYLGQLFMRGERSYLPLYMAAATFLGIVPFLALLNSDFPNHNGFKSKFYSVLGGCVASLPSVNVRPCIINVNPPESRGAALTAANLFVTLGRGMGPTCIVLLGSIFDASRQTSFNITLSVFWTISAIQLLFLAKTLPLDQDAMEEGLARYAAAAHAINNNNNNANHNHDASGESGGADEENYNGGADHPQSPVRTQKDFFQPKTTPGDDEEEEEDELLYKSIISSPPAQYMTIDGKSARQSLRFVTLGIQEFGDEITLRNAHCLGCDTISPCESHEDIASEQRDNRGRNRNDLHENGSSGVNPHHENENANSSSNSNNNNNNINNSINTSHNQEDTNTTSAMEGDVLFSQEDEISEQELERRRIMWKRRQQHK